jgi:hypothetical protein
MFPAISPSQRSPFVQFTLRMESIEDLFYDGSDPNAEILKVQSVLDAHNGKLLSLYNNVGDKGMNRKCFRRMSGKLVGDVADVAADEIFSSVTNLYEGETSNPQTSNDIAMSACQFVGGIVRLANLKALMDDGMVNTSELAAQTAKFLQSA